MTDSKKRQAIREGLQCLSQSHHDKLWRIFHPMGHTGGPTTMDAWIDTLTGRNLTNTMRLVQRTVAQIRAILVA